MYSALAFLVVLALSITQPALAHGGGLNADGCHTNHKTGEYHCHRSPSKKRQSGGANVAPASRQLAPARHEFRNCAEARAAGAAPVRRGDPGYAPNLDRDNDGIGCE